MKNSNLQVEEYIYYIVQLIAKGTVSTQEIIQNFTIEYPNANVKERQIYNYIKEAKNQIGGTLGEWEKEELRKMALLRYNALYNRAYKSSLYGECRQIQAQIDKLLGLNEEQPQKMELSVKAPVFKMVDAEKLENDIPNDDVPQD